ncbi:MAG TPA: flagellar basal body P-ring protein FlgI [Tepidisphaeraceae bacterium]
MSRMLTGAAGLLLLLTGCTQKPVAPPAPVQARLPQKEVPEFLKGSIWEQVDVANVEPMRVSGFGLVVNLSGTGDTRAPNPVREYMIKQMQKHGFGSSVQTSSTETGFEKLGPEAVLNDKDRRVAVVRVDGFIPAGARKGQRFDVQVSALENSNTTSLHRGTLYETDLSPRGADPFNPGAGAINPWARVNGPIFVSPEYALENNAQTTMQKLSLRYGLVMGRGTVMQDRPLVFKLRGPEKRMARAIEYRIDERFQDSNVAAAKDEGEIWINVPPSFGDDWERFIGVVTHLYFNYSAEFAAIKARQLSEIALRDRDKAPLMDISYCWEGLGEAALPEIRPLLSSDSPEVAFAAARAGAHLGDVASQEALGRIALTENHPFQLNAIRSLSSMSRNTRVTTVLREILDTDQLLARIEAYKALVALNDSTVYTRSIREKYLLDIVPSKGPPLIYASRTGIPRIAVIGQRAEVRTPVLFLAMANHFNIVADAKQPGLTMFYRGTKYEPDVKVESQQDIAVVIARMGGEGTPGEPRLNFGYGDVVGLVQRLAEAKLIVTQPSMRNTQLAAVFQMEAVSGLDDPILNAPPIVETSAQRPQGAEETPLPTNDVPTLPPLPTPESPMLPDLSK